MPKTRRQRAVAVVSADGLEYRDPSREYDQHGGVSHTPPDIEVQRLLTLVQKRKDLGLRQLQYMATCLAAKTLQCRCRRLEMVPDTPEPWQAD